MKRIGFVHDESPHSSVPSPDPEKFIPAPPYSAKEIAGFARPLQESPPDILSLVAGLIEKREDSEIILATKDFLRKLNALKAEGSEVSLILALFSSETSINAAVMKIRERLVILRNDAAGHQKLIELCEKFLQKLQRH